MGVDQPWKDYRLPKIMNLGMGGQLIPGSYGLDPFLIDKYCRWADSFRRYNLSRDKGQKGHGRRFHVSEVFKTSGIVRHSLPVIGEVVQHSLDETVPSSRTASFGSISSAIYTSGCRHLLYLSDALFGRRGSDSSD
jgi:hypothetical protein